MFLVCFSPTSTAFPVAINFAETGMILELKNNKSDGLTFFNCVLSDFSDESEKLLINGGYWTGNSLQFTALAFSSIISLEYNLNYKHFIIAISSFQTIIKGRNAIKNNLICSKKHMKRLQKLIDIQLSSMNTTNETNTGPNSYGMKYIQNMFSEYLKSRMKIQIFIPIFNLRKWKKGENNPLFLIYRGLFCNEFANEVLIENKNEWQIKSDSHWYHMMGDLNCIQSLKVELLLKLCVNVKTFDILQLPITRYVMDDLLTIVSAEEYAIERFFVGNILHAFNDDGCYPKIQNDFQSFDECWMEYNEKFMDVGWNLRVINDVKVGSAGFYIQGLEIVSKECTLDFDEMCQSFFM